MTTKAARLYLQEGQDAEEGPEQKFITSMGAILCTWRRRIVVPGEYCSLDFSRVRDRTESMLVTIRIAWF
jgi:hypothetical protein